MNFKGRLKKIQKYFSFSHVGIIKNLLIIVRNINFVMILFLK